MGTGYDRTHTSLVHKVKELVTDPAKGLNNAWDYLFSSSLGVSVVFIILASATGKTWFSASVLSISVSERVAGRDINEVLSTILAVGDGIEVIVVNVVRTTRRRAEYRYRNLSAWCGIHVLDNVDNLRGQAFV